MAPEKAELAPDAQAFVAWARSEAVSLSIPRRDEDFADLDFIGEVIGDARVVAFGESAHYLHEWNRFRARLFKYLAQQHGFTTFVLESGLVEGKNIHDYVDGADVEWDTVVASVTNGWGVWAELQELITWMRDYNADPGNDRRLRFYGTDGSGNWSHAATRPRSGPRFLAHRRRVSARRSCTRPGIERAADRNGQPWTGRRIDLAPTHRQERAPHQSHRAKRVRLHRSVHARGVRLGGALRTRAARSAPVFVRRPIPTSPRASARFGTRATLQ